MAVREPLDLTGLAQAASGTIYAGLASDPELVHKFGGLAGRQLVSGGAQVNRELLSRVRGSLLSAFDGQLGKLEGLVVMRSEPTGMSTEQTQASAAFESGLIAGVTAVGVPVVGVELSNTEPSQVPWYKSVGISSVDDLDALAGQAALVYALAGSQGTYGTKSTADSAACCRRVDLRRLRGSSSREASRRVRRVCAAGEAPERVRSVASFRPCTPCPSCWRS